MVYDPAWDMPQLNWKQQGSFEGGAVPPVTEPDAGTQVLVGPFAQEWMPYICGALDQLRNPSAWIVADDTAMYNTLRRVDTLLGLICGGEASYVATEVRLQDCVLQTSTDGGTTWTDAPGWAANFAACVRAAIPPPPPNPGPNPIEQRACNIAGFLASELVQAALAKAVAEYGSTVTYIDFALWVAQNTFAVALPYAYAFSEAVFNAWKALTAGNIADFRAAITDPVLIADITCAIFTAIRADGEVTDANWPAAVAAVCAISYAPADIIPVICSLMTTTGSVNARALQPVGAFEVVDCSGCADVWCYEWDFRAGTADWTLVPGLGGVYVPGVGYETTLHGGELRLDLDLVFPHNQLMGRVDVLVTSPDGSGSGPRRVTFYRGSTNLGNVDLTHAALASCFALNAGLAVVTNELYVQMHQSDVAATPDIVCAIRISAAGVNPWGANNCV